METAGDEHTEGPLTEREEDLLREAGLSLADLAPIANLPTDNLGPETLMDLQSMPVPPSYPVEPGQWANLPATPYDASEWVLRSDQPNA